MAKIEFRYDEENDLFFIRKEGNVKGNLEIGKIILDITNKGEVIGVEVLDAVDTLEPFGITKEILRHVATARLITRKSRGAIYFGFALSAPAHEEATAMMAIPQLINN